MTSDCNHVDRWPLVWRPLDPDFEGTDLMFEECAYVGPLPRWIRVQDARWNYCTCGPRRARLRDLRHATRRGKRLGDHIGRAAIRVGCRLMKYLHSINRSLVRPCG